MPEDEAAQPLRGAADGRWHLAHHGGSQDVGEHREEWHAPSLVLDLVGRRRLNLAVGIGRVEARRSQQGIGHHVRALCGVDAVFTATVDGHSFLAADRDRSVVGSVVTHQSHNDADNTHQHQNDRHGRTCTRTPPPIVRPFRTGIRHEGLLSLWKSREKLAPFG